MSLPTDTRSAAPSRARRAASLGSIFALLLLTACSPFFGGYPGTKNPIADRRTAGTYVEDEGIEWRIRSATADLVGDYGSVNVTSFNRIALLTGQLPDNITRTSVEAVARKVTGVREIINQIAIAPLPSVAARANDSLITSNIRARMLTNKVPNSRFIKVVTEANVVYLMGIVTEAEARAATETARTSKGVKKVVRAFEYVKAKTPSAQP